MAQSLQSLETSPPEAPHAPAPVRTPVKPARSRAHEFRERVTDELIAQVEAGTAPWQKPWNPAMGDDTPRNAVTDQPYRGGNREWLQAVSPDGDPRWATYKQAQEKGWQVKPGASGTQIEYWEQVTRDKSPAAVEKTKDAAEKMTGTTPESVSSRETILVHKTYTVFHASQIDGIPPHTPEPVQPRHELAGQVAAAVGAPIITRGGTAAYSPITDTITMPPRGTFDQKMPGGYEATLLHESAHATGHESRLNRPLLNKFGTPDYAREELRAEMTSAILARELGVPHDPGQHAAYAANWVKALQEDKNELFRAAADAQKIAGYMIERAREQGIAVDLPANSSLAAAVKKGPVEQAQAEEKAAKTLGIDAQRWTGRVTEIAEDRSSVTMRAAGRETEIKMLPGQQLPKDVAVGIYGKLTAGKDSPVAKFEVVERSRSKEKATGREIER